MSGPTNDDPPGPPAISVVMVVYNMEREFPRTLQSLAPEFQRGIEAGDYEVIVVDNGSSRPLDEQVLAAFPGRLRAVRIDDASPSPAAAANAGLALAAADLVGLLIDGARMVSPGLLALARLASRLHERPITATLGWHLGPVRHMEAAEAGYDQGVEDALLEESGWESDGYRLFEISTLAGSSRRGWFGQLNETNGLFMPRPLWDEVGGLDERFSLPGGGLVNHDLYRRVCALTGVQLVLLLGEGTFHQYHGGAATSRQLDWAEMHAEYEQIRAQPFRPPATEPLYVGTVPRSTLAHLQHSVRWAVKAADRPAVTPDA